MGEEFLWGSSFWADGYFAETVGKVDEETVGKVDEETVGKVDEETVGKVDEETIRDYTQ